MRHLKLWLWHIRAQCLLEDLSVRDYDSDILNLQLDCDYDIQVSSGDSNPHIDRITPFQQRVKVTEADIRNINILVFKRMNQIYIKWKCGH